MSSLNLDQAIDESSEHLQDPTQIVARKRSITVLIVGAVIVLTLFVELLGSVLLQKRAQDQLLTQFSTTLDTAASAFGQAGLSPLPDTAPAIGSAVAVLSIPKLGISQVVAEGNQSSVTQTGPGHVPGTSLPGQMGEATIVGRRSTFGAPFYKLNRLVPGDLVQVVTVEGQSTYKVIATPAVIEELPSNRLALVSSNPPILSTGSMVVYAQLEGKPYVGTPKNSPITPAHSGWPTLILLGLGLFALVKGSVWAKQTFNSRVRWVLLVPVGLALIAALTLAIDGLLPATI